MKTRSIKIFVIGALGMLLALTFSSAGLTPAPYYEPGGVAIAGGAAKVAGGVTGTTGLSVEVGVIMLHVAEMTPDILRAWLMDKERRDFLGSDFDFDDIDRLLAGD